jgi:hypothetical protein
MQYKVVPGPTASVGGLLSGPNLMKSAEPVERIIQQAAASGWKLHSIDSSVASGKCLCIFPRNVEVKLIVFYKDS